MKQEAVSIPEINAHPIEFVSKKTAKEIFSNFDINVFKRLARYAVRGVNRIKLPGMNGLSVYYAGKFFFHGMNILKLTERTSAVTYNFLMALPPSLLFLFSLVPHLPVQHAEQHILHIIKLLAPNHKIYVTVSSVLADFMHKTHYDVLSLGIVMALFFSSNGMMGLMRSFDKSQTLYKKRTGMQRRGTAIILTTMLIGVVMMALSVFIIQGKKLNSFLRREFHSVVGIKIVSIVLLILIVFLAISMIYKYGPSLKHRFSFASAGSIYATVATITVTSVFFFLVTNFIHYNKLYGSIGTLTAFMVLVWLNTAIILIGYELNVNLLLSKLAQGKVEHNHE